MDLYELYRWNCRTPEWSTTDPSVALHSGVLQNLKYLTISTTDPSVGLHSGVLQNPKYLNTYTTDPSVVLHSGVLQNPKYLSTSQSILLQGGAVYNTKQSLSN